METIIISVSQYKEKDAVVTAISREGTYKFFARGIFNRTNKNSFLTNFFSKANINLIDGKIKYPILESAQLVASPISSNPTFEQLQAIMSFQEMIFNCIDEDEAHLIYDILDKAINDLKNQINPFFVCLKFYLNVLPILGYEFDVNHCVSCGNKKSIVDFSFIEGGFICKNCLDNTKRIYNNNQLLLIRNIILNNGLIDTQTINDDDVKNILKDVSIFIDDALGYHLKSLDILIK